MNGSQVLGYLARKDKWFLGGGKKVIWAPEFPLWLDKPGFWDHACYLDYKVGPIFTVTIIGERGREVKLNRLERYWQPDHFSQLYRDPSRELTVQERRALLPWDVLASSFEISHLLKQEQTFDIIVWSAQERFESQGIYELDGSQVRQRDGTMLWRRRVRDARVPRNSADLDNGLMMKFAVALGANRSATSFSIKTSDRQPNYPRWKYSPFYEKLAEHGHLGNEAPETLDPDYGGLTYFGLHYKVTIPPGGRAGITFFAAIAGSEEEALINLRVARRREDLSRRQPPPENPEAADPTPTPPTETPDRDRRPTYPAKRHWREYFESVPDFTCSDPYIQKYYWYRWYGLRLNTIRAEDDQRLGLPYPCVFEGINLGWFRQHITYSAQCHMLEARWMHDPALAQGSLLNFVVHQLDDGSFPGVIKNIYHNGRSQRIGAAFYHSNWGMAVRELHRVHPDRAFLEKVYQPLADYLGYFQRVRDADQTGLYDVLSHWETGQEFMSRYQQVDPQADQGGNFRLKGLDATVYIYELQQTLAWMAGILDKPEAGRWLGMANTTRQAVRQRMWDPAQEFFYDVDPATGQRITAKAAVGFYPFMAQGLAGPEHLGSFRHLFNENEFWTPYPVPTTSQDDSTYSPNGEWQGQRLVCPWNGRTWLMTNSHVAEALARASQDLDTSLQPKAVELINRFIRMLFLDDDLERPSSYEYYNPITGQAPYFRGTEDYMHSFIVDIIIKYVVGVQPDDEGRVRIRPLPFNLDYFTLDRLKVGGHWLKITWRKSASLTEQALNKPDYAPVGLTVWVDGERVANNPTLEPLEIKLSQ